MSYRILPENVRLAIMSDVFEALEVYGLASQSFQKSEEKNIRLVVLDELLSGEQSIDELLRVTLQKHEKIERVFGPLIAFIEKRIEEQLFLRCFKESINQFNELNERIESLNNVIKEIEAKSINTKYELKGFIIDLQKRYAEKADKIYISLNEMLKEVNKSREEFTSDEIMKIKNDLLREIKSQKDEIEQERIIDAVKPLMQNTIEYELKDKGRLIQIFREELVRISHENKPEIQKIFKDILESLMGRGVQRNAKLAREAVESGVKSMSDNEIEETFGRVFKVAESKSGTGQALADFAKKFKRSERIGANPAKSFFDGLSFTIYYYICIRDTGKVSPSKEFIPSNWLKPQKYYAEKFEEKIEPFEEKRNKSLDSYKDYGKSFSIIIEENDSESIEISCFIRYYNDMRLYVFMNQEPSEYFKKEVEKIIKMPKNKDIIGLLNNLTANYTVPKVQFAVFNRGNFLLPTNDSILAIRDESKSLSDTEEIELFNVLKENIKEQCFSNKLSVIERIKRRFSSDKTKIEYFDENSDIFYEKPDSWFIWATLKPSKRYLAIKMQEIDLKLSNKPGIKEAFCKNIYETVWKKLKRSTSPEEMQELVDMFIRKDAGILSENTKWMSTFLNIWRFVPYILIVLVILWGYSVLIPMKLDIQNSLFQSEIRLEAKSYELKKHSNIWEEQVKNISQELKNRSSDLEWQVRELSVFLDEKQKYSFAEKQLKKDCDPPFKFKKETSELSDENTIVLNRIADNLIYLKDWKIKIYPYNNIPNYQKLNTDRAERVKKFLYSKNVPQNLVILDDMIKNKQIEGVKLEPIKIE